MTRQEQTVRVDLDSLAHKHNKLGEPFTELTLVLPSGTDLRLLHRAARVQKAGKGGTVTAQLNVTDEAGERRTFNLFFVKSTAKDFRFGAVMRLDGFNPHHNLEHFLAGYVLRESADALPHLDFHVLLETINANPMLTATEEFKDGVQKMVNESPGIESVTLSSGGRTVVLTSAHRDRVQQLLRRTEPHDTN